MQRIITEFSADKSGATAIEYGFIALFIAIAIIASVTAIGGNLSAFFTTLGGSF